MKQTAVEWLEKEFEDYGSNSHLSLDWNTFDELCEQAKAMEKEQIKNAWIEATPRNIPKYEAITRERAEEYYNKTFKK